MVRKGWGAGAAVLGRVAAWFRGPGGAGRRVPPWLAWLSAGGAAVGGLAVLAVVAFGPGPQVHRPGQGSVVRGPLPAGTYPEQPLRPGNPLPPLRAAGWVNSPGAPVARGSLLVLDIWALW